MLLLQAPAESLIDLQELATADCETQVAEPAKVEAPAVTSETAAPLEEQDGVPAEDAAAKQAAPTAPKVRTQGVRDALSPDIPCVSCWHICHSVLSSFPASLIAARICVVELPGCYLLLHSGLPLTKCFVSARHHMSASWCR